MRGYISCLTKSPQLPSPEFKGLTKLLNLKASDFDAWRRRRHGGVSRPRLRAARWKEVERAKNDGGADDTAPLLFGLACALAVVLAFAKHCTASFACAPSGRCFPISLSLSVNVSLLFRDSDIGVDICKDPGIWLIFLAIFVILSLRIRSFAAGFGPSAIQSS